METGGAGTALLEIFDLESGLGPALLNTSTRGRAGIGDDVLIGGFIVGRPGGSANLRVAVRAIGPSLASHGLAETLQNPTLSLFDQNGVEIALNDNWQQTQEAEIRGTGIPPTDALEAAIVRELPPGPYTAIVRGVNGSTGVALIEVYALE